MEDQEELKMAGNLVYGNAKSVFQNVYNLPFDLSSLLESQTLKGKIVSEDRINDNTALLYWIVFGQCRVTVNREKRILTEGDFFYVLYREGVQLECLSESCRYRFIGLFGPLAEAVLLSYRLPRFLPLERDPEPLWKELVGTASSRNEIDRRRIVSLILGILACVGGAENGANPGERLIEQGRRLIHQYLADPELGVDFLCEKLQVSRSRLTALFHRYLKVSPGREILNRRLVRAYALLRGTDYSIGKIAEECGFRDPKTFSRFIHRSSGMGPREFRDQFQRENETGPNPIGM